MYSADEALALMLDTDVTRDKYTLMHQGAKRKGSHLYPCYDIVRGAKKKCYPSEDCITVSESCARVTLQALLDHTTNRIAQIEEPLQIILEKETTELITTEIARSMACPHFMPRLGSWNISFTSRTAEFSNFGRSYRTKHSQQYCRVKGNRDVLNMLLCTSDPFLYTRRSITPRVQHQPTPEMVALFKD
ncbi:Nitrilotriacetate monooxygenase component A [Frankliniella fusca]|uniref:Nitrilotriacetate monooxygenase component A n=1 Tax=Frankliniella fusca TaxID=407009 RepID=A0AAE1LI32_9NEOP|nr:Nitrilotriacetate monooxygenase component A [Frankliniella fusca]